MEEGAVLGLRDVAQQVDLSWQAIGASLVRDGRLRL
jgi:hypothetical protein